MVRAFGLISKLRARPKYLLSTDTKFAYALPLSFVWMRLLFYQPLFFYLGTLVKHSQSGYNLML